jgi:hypothetical protein
MCRPMRRLSPSTCIATPRCRRTGRVCTHFVYKVGTDTCYFKSPDNDGGLGREDREGYVAGKVVLR